MDWTAAVNGYCERLGPGLWAEPWNAVTNLAFLLVAAALWRPAGAAPGGRALCLVLALIGVGSGLFHTVAQRWAGLADVLPILGFILLYLWLVNRELLGWPLWGCIAATVVFFPWAAASGRAVAQVPGLAGAAGYAGVPLLIAGYALALAGRSPRLARDFAVGAALLVVSLAFRTLDAPLCPAWPRGTHFLWHLLNAAMLGWMIRAYLRGWLAGAALRR